jgi:antitoxin component of MazEF toxin-antitoxin module
MQEKPTVELTIASGVPAEPAVTLESLIEQMTDENRRDEVQTGRSVGKEAW